MMGSTLLVYITWMLYLILVVWVMVFAFKSRQSKNKMAGMVAAMAIGMVVGLAIGASAPIIWGYPFFTATLIGVVVGGSCGWIAGLGSGLIGMLDGLLSGIMGGMMGAMLGVMVPSEQQHALFHLLSLFSGGTLFLIFLLLHRGGQVKGNRSYIQQYILLLSLFLLTSYVYPLPQDGSNSKLDGNIEEQIIHVTVHAEEFTFFPSEVRLVKDQPVVILLHNNGQETHGFEWRDDESGPIFRLYANPGEHVAGMFIPRTSGTFQASCPLPGHKEAGMAIQMQVVD